jgi:hypothetical protein
MSYFWLKGQKERGYREDLGIDWKVILNQTADKEYRMA